MVKTYLLNVNKLKNATVFERYYQMLSLERKRKITSYYHITRYYSITMKIKDNLLETLKESKNKIWIFKTSRYRDIRRGDNQIKKRLLANT